MLVLTRHASESIIVGKCLVKFKILEICGQSVRIGIEAHPDISIHREEIYKRIAGLDDNKLDETPPSVNKVLKPRKEKVPRQITQPDIEVLNEAIDNIGNR